MCSRLLFCLLWFLQYLQPSAVSGLLALWPLSSFSLLSCPLLLFLFLHLQFWFRHFKITSLLGIVLFRGLLEIMSTQTCACAPQIIASVVLYGKLWEIGLALSSHTIGKRNLVSLINKLRLAVETLNKSPGFLAFPPHLRKCSEGFRWWNLLTRTRNTTERKRCEVCLPVKIDP